MKKPTRYRSIPRTGQQGADTQAIIENMEVLTGNRGDGLFRALTPYDLQELGLITVNIRNGRQIIETPKVEEEVEAIVETPTKPENVEAKGGFSSILVRWDRATFSGYAHTEVFRADVDDFGAAVLIGTTIASLYSDPVGPEAAYYYWVRFINVNGEEGPIHDTHGAYAETAIDPELLLEKLTGEIKETHLFQDLNSRIDLIDAPGTGLATKVQQLELDTEGLAEQTDQLALNVGGNTYSIQQQSQILGDVSASYTVKIDANGYVAGYGLATEPNGEDGVIASMGFSVDRFYVGSPGAEKLSFVIDSGRVVMDAAYIKDATITSAKIASVNTDKLVVTDQAEIFNAIIADASITSAKIAGHIQSDNYVHNGGVGWAINKNGAAVFNNIYARGNIEASSIKADSVEAKHIKGGAVSSMDSFTKTGLNVIYGQSVFALGISCDIPSGESGNVMVLVNFQGQAASRNTNMGVAIYGLRPGLPSILLHTSDRSVDSDFTESSSTSCIWKNAPAGSSIHVYMRNTHSTGQILNGVVICNRLTTIR